MAAPGVGAHGCVESTDLKAFVSALEDQRRVNRDRALAALGARYELRRGAFGKAPAGAKLGETYDVAGARHAVVAYYAAGSETTVPLARHGNQLRPLQERPRAHGISVRACGVARCTPARDTPAPSPPLPVTIELGPGETLGAPLLVSYDYWWARVTQADERPCKGRGDAAGPYGAASGASEVPRTGR